MKFSFKFTETDWLAFNKYHIAKSRNKTGWFFALMLGPLFFFVMAFFDYLQYGFEIGLFIYVIFAVLWIIFLPIFIDFFVNRRLEKLFKEGNNAKLFGRTKAEFTDIYIKTERPNRKTEIAWNDLYGYVENNDYLFIYLNTFTAIIINKKSIKPKKDTGKVIKFVKSKLKQRLSF